MTLTYVPNYFDILPMYFVLMLLVPAFIWLRWHLNPVDCYYLHNPDSYYRAE